MSKRFLTVTTIIIFVLVAFILVFVGFYASLSHYRTDTEGTPAGLGRVILGVTDELSSLDDVTSIVITVDKVEVHNTAQGWITVSSGPKLYDLIALKQSDTVKLLADVFLPTGTYEQIRLNISEVEVTAAGDVHTAKLPSGVLRIAGRVVVTDAQVAGVVIDFVADKSLHITGNDKYIFAPVVKLETRSSADVDVRGGTVEVSGGTIEEQETVGMDEKGEVKADFELDKELEIDAQGRIHAKVR